MHLFQVALEDSLGPFGFQVEHQRVKGIDEGGATSEGRRRRRQGPSFSGQRRSETRGVLGSFSEDTRGGGVKTRAVLFETMPKTSFKRPG